jgi:hypothetical protein
MIYSSGEIKLNLWSADWKIPAGHRIGVRVTDSNDDWWINVPTFSDVTLHGGSVTLPFLRFARPDTIQGDPGVQLADYLSQSVTVPPETLASSTSKAFALPPEQVKAKSGPADGRRHKHRHHR